MLSCIYDSSYIVVSILYSAYESFDILNLLSICSDQGFCLLIASDALDILCVLLYELLS